MTSLIATLHIFFNEQDVTLAKAAIIHIQSDQGNIELNLPKPMNLNVGAHVVQCQLDGGKWSVLSVHSLSDVSAAVNPTPNQRMATSTTQTLPPSQPAKSAAKAVTPPPKTVRPTPSQSKPRLITPPSASRQTPTTRAAPKQSAASTQTNIMPPITRPKSRPATTTIQPKNAGGFSASPKSSTPSAPDLSKRAPVIHSNPMDSWDDCDIPF